MANPYDTGLDKNPANYQPLTPLVFLERAAQVHPTHTAIIHGSEHTSYADFYARTRKLASALASRGIGEGDTVSVMLANTPAMLEAHYGVPMTGAVLHSINTRLDANAVAFMLDHAGTKVLIGDTEFGPVLKQALETDQGEAASDRLSRHAMRGRRDAARQSRLRGLHRRRRPRFPLVDAVGRMERHLAQLYERHDRQPQGRRLPPSRRGADVLRQHHRHRHGPAPDLSVDAADVPLQRLVLPLVDLTRVGHPCLPPLGARQADVRGDRQAWGDASLRRALRHVGPAQRDRGGEAPVQPSRRLQPCRGAPARRRARQDGRGGLRAHPSLRADRDLRPGHAERVARGVGRAARGGPARQAHPPGRALSRARGSDRDAPRDHGEGRGRRRDARARSCSAAIS